MDRKIVDALHQESNIVLLDSIRRKGEDTSSLFFSKPERIIVLNSADELPPFFKEIERLLSRHFYLAGWFSYELGYLLHRKLNRLLSCKRPAVPLAWLGVYNDALEIDPGCLETPDESGERSRDITIRLELTNREFKKSIRIIHDYIRMGHTYQVNFTVRGRFSCNDSPSNLYLSLRRCQSVNYAAFIRTGSGLSVLSLSPELFFKKEGDMIWSKPMKGTAPRGGSPEEDGELAKFLMNDEKNRAENVMIVDLLRNDLGMVCKAGSVRVPDLFKIERYETLFQMISKIEGQLRQPSDISGIFKALFPCGSITGAPKIRTMEIISELERSPRGIYTGAIGYISPHGRACFNVAIRTIVMDRGMGEIGLGAGITIGSDPDSELDEVVLKARFLSRDVRY